MLSNGECYETETNSGICIGLPGPALGCVSPFYRRCEGSETELPLVTEVVLGTIPPTEEQIPTAAFSDENRIMETFPQDELAIVEYIEEPASEFADAFTQFRFEGYDDGMPLSDGITYAVSEGESLNLEIVRCIWTPVDNLMYIGVFNSETETGYA